jgi:eukaryotic-like serine/threonine-protein kinase
MSSNQTLRTPRGDASGQDSEPSDETVAGDRGQNEQLSSGSAPADTTVSPGGAERAGPPRASGDTAGVSSSDLTGDSDTSGVQQPVLGGDKPPALDSAFELALRRRDVTCLSPNSGTLVRDAPISERLHAPADERFEERELVGKGGMGSVFLTFDHVMLREVALKRLHADAEEIPGTEQHFIEEAQITGQLDHPNIVPVYDLDRAPKAEHAFFIMKYVDGETYDRGVRRFHAEPTDAKLHGLLRAFLKVCDAMSFAHDRGVIHCDLKPENIMVGAHGQVYVMDWGVAQLRSGHRPSDEAPTSVSLSNHEQRYQSIGGTFGYMAPEQLEGLGEHIDPTTDVYCLGGILYYVLTGQPPRSVLPPNVDIAEWKSFIPSVEGHKAVAEVPPELARIIQRALSPAHSDRYQSVPELSADLEEFLAGGGWFATRRYAPGETIISEGESGDEAFIITAGECDVFKGSGDEPTLLRRMGAGDAFGELSVLSERPRSATVVAVTPVTVRVVTTSALKRELARNPVLHSFMTAVTSRFADIEAQLEQALGK